LETLDLRHFGFSDFLTGHSGEWESQHDCRRVVVFCSVPPWSGGKPLRGGIYLRSKHSK